MPSIAEVYEAKAREFERAAREARDPWAREQLQELAQSWRDLARREQQDSLGDAYTENGLAPHKG
jgi:hypothetical protein